MNLGQRKIRVIYKYLNISLAFSIRSLSKDFFIPNAPQAFACQCIEIISLGFQGKYRRRETTLSFEYSSETFTLKVRRFAKV